MMYEWDDYFQHALIVALGFQRTILKVDVTIDVPNSSFSRQDHTVHFKPKFTSDN